MVWRALLLKGELWLSIFAFHRPRWYWVEDLRTWMICRETEFIHRCCRGRTVRVLFILSSLLSLVYFIYILLLSRNKWKKCDAFVSSLYTFNEGFDGYRIQVSQDRFFQMRFVHSNKRFRVRKTSITHLQTYSARGRQTNAAVVTHRRKLGGLVQSILGGWVGILCNQLRDVQLK